jgi:hypothetical protein
MAFNNNEFFNVINPNNLSGFDKLLRFATLGKIQITDGVFVTNKVLKEISKDAVNNPEFMYEDKCQLMGALVECARLLHQQSDTNNNYGQLTIGWSYDPTDLDYDPISIFYLADAKRKKLIVIDYPIKNDECGELNWKLIISSFAKKNFIKSNINLKNTTFLSKIVE